MNHFDLKFAKYIQEHAPIELSCAEKDLERTESTLKRSIRTINQHLPNEYRIAIEHKCISTRFSYSAYMALLSRIQCKDYITTPQERTKALTVALCLNNVVNKKSFYEAINVSHSTLKNDREQLEQFLASYGLALAFVPKQGTRIVGSEPQFRVLSSRIIMKVVEVAPDNQLIEHKSNSPMNRLVAMDFLRKCHEEIQNAVIIFNALVSRHGLPSYNHKKFFLVYLTLTLRRIKNGHTLTMAEFSGFISPPDLCVFTTESAESHFASLLLTVDIKPQQLVNRRAEFILNSQTIV